MAKQAILTQKPAQITNGKLLTDRTSPGQRDEFQRMSSIKTLISCIIHITVVHDVQGMMYK
jgi:hypothetical protein